MNRPNLFTWALVLALITIFYNVGEGLFSVYWGSEDGTLALFGFGLDSFVEVISGIGVLHMLLRSEGQPVVEADRFERQSLRVTSLAFFILGTGLAISAVVNIIQNKHPQTTFWGVIVALVSLVTMFWLFRLKMGVGKRMANQAMISDAYCTLTCIYLSFILLGSSFIYLQWGIGYIDSFGSLGIAFYAVREGKETWRKAATASLNCRCED